MKRCIGAPGRTFSVIALAICLSCSPRRTPVQENVLVGRWQQVDKPAITMTFLKEGTFSASVAGQRILGGKYRLVNGEQLVLDCDAASLKVGPLTNRAFMAGEKLVIVSADGNTESYHRAAQPSE